MYRCDTNNESIATCIETVFFVGAGRGFVWKEDKNTKTKMKMEKK